MSMNNRMQDDIDNANCASDKSGFNYEAYAGYDNKCPYQKRNCLGASCAHYVKKEERCCHVLLAISTRAIAYYLSKS